MSLNQLINEQDTDEQPSLDVLAVKNGAHFCVLVDRATQITYQLGADQMSSPFEDPSVPVALTELRDTTFQSEMTFACGDYFVIG
jgi:hypothetical protein